MEWTTESITELLESYVGDIDPSTKKGQKRRAILEVATAMFAEHGYRGTSMDELASAVGVAKGTLYLYFPKKIDLLFACAALVKLEWMPEVFALLDGSDSELPASERRPASERLKEWIKLTLLLPSRSPLFVRLLEDREMAAMLADYPANLLAEGQEAAAKLLQPLLDEVAGPHRWNAAELRDRVNVIRMAGFIAPMLRHEALRPGTSIERFAEIYADLIVDGIRPRDEAEEATP